MEGAYTAVEREMHESAKLVKIAVWVRGRLDEPFIHLHCY